MSGYYFPGKKHPHKIISWMPLNSPPRIPRRKSLDSAEDNCWFCGGQFLILRPSQYSAAIKKTCFLISAGQRLHFLIAINRIISVVNRVINHKTFFVHFFCWFFLYDHTTKAGVFNLFWPREHQIGHEVPPDAGPYWSVKSRDIIWHNISVDRSLGFSSEQWDDCCFKVS